MQGERVGGEGERMETGRGWGGERCESRQESTLEGPGEKEAAHSSPLRLPAPVTQIRVLPAQDETAAGLQEVRMGGARIRKGSRGWGAERVRRSEGWGPLG